MLNLLPPAEKKILALERRKRLSVILCFEFLTFLVCILLVLLAIEFYILGEIAEQNSLLYQVGDEKRSSEFLYFKDTLQDYNRKLILISSFLDEQRFSGNALRILLSVERPSGLSFTGLSMQPKDKSDRMKVSISGISDTRDNLLIFKDNIESEKGIENANFSPECWISPKDIKFSLTLDIIDGK